MASFIYVAIGGNGLVEKGELSAASRYEAVQVLAERSLVPVKLDEVQETTAMPQRVRSVKKSDIVALVRELATLSSSGVSLADSLVTLRDANTRTALYLPLSTMVNAIHGGEKISTALESSGLSLPDFALALVRAGEATGNMGFALSRCADQMEFDARMREQAREAMVYPSILVVTGIFAVVFIFSFVVPRFASLLKGKTDSLPWISAMVLKIGSFVNANLLLVLGGLVGGTALAFFILRLPEVRRGLLQVFSGAPVFSDWIHSGETARWTSSLSVLLESKVPVLTAIELAASSLRLGRYREKLMAVRDDVNRGKRFAQAVESRQLLEPTSMSMVKVGEQTGDMAAMLGHVAEYWGGRNRGLQRRLVALVEPVAILLIAGVIGVVMVGVVLAMTSLTEVKL